MIILFLLFGFLLLVSSGASADTIHTKDGRELKGIVVEDYRDRLTFSTADGEVSVMKSEIGELAFDTEEDNLIKLAELAQERGDYVTAYGYYELATRANPDFKKAKDGMVFLHGYLFRKDEIRKEEAVKRQEALERNGAFIRSEGSAAEESVADRERLKSEIGITLEMKGVYPEVTEARKGSAAYEAGVRRGDLLIAIWGKLTGYMPLGAVIKALLDKPSLEIKCAIERTVALPSDEGASFGMEFDGLTAISVKDGSQASASGLWKADLITAINGQSTRYMPLKKALELIKGSREKDIKLTLRRELLLWRKMEA